MITKFRLEGEGQTKEGVIEELSSQALKVMQLVNPGGARGQWECTDDVTFRVKKQNIPIGYQGRMNFIFKRADNRDAADY